MTKPDSTDAGGVTHEEARRLIKSCYLQPEHYGNRQVLLTYIDAQEAAIATLTN